MKKLYTWGGKFSNRNITVSDLIKNKGTKKYIQTTATNAEEALAFVSGQVTDSHDTRVPAANDNQQLSFDFDEGVKGVAAQ